MTDVLTHELGHFLNLCHTQLNADLADDGDPANDAYLPIMFPFRSDDDLESDPVLRFDDATMLSMLYPAPGFFCFSSRSLPSSDTRIASSALKHPAVFGRMTYRDRSR